MARSSKESFNALYAIAQEQHGFFTTKQAISAGFIDALHAYHVRQGNWIRENRGIYRLANYPPAERPDLMLWYLWSRNREDVPQGVFSHQTALGLHDLSDLNPSVLHMTVPKRFRRNSMKPKRIVLHFIDLPAKDTQIIYGVRVTKPLRTIIDLSLEGDVMEDVLIQSAREGVRRGIITIKQIDGMKDSEAMNPFIGDLLKIMRGKHG